MIERPLFSFERPKTLDELRAILHHARERGLHVRVVGAQHSIEDAIYGTEESSAATIVVSMASFDRVEFVRDARRRRNEKTLIRVEAGVHFAEAPYVAPVPSPQAQLDRWLRAHGVDLVHVGGIVQQTVVGFLATGSSGGSWTHCLHDQVVEVQLLDAQGHEHRLTPDDERFAAAGVSLGLLGIVISVTLAVEPAFDVQGHETFEGIELPPEEKGPAARGFLADHEYARMIWWPQNGTAQLWRAHAIQRRPDVRYNPYLPTGVETLGRQVLTSILYVLIENLGTLESVRALHEKLRGARIPDYLDLLAHEARYRPVGEQETDIEVLERDPFYHWSLSRFRRPRVVRADLSAFVALGEEALVGLARRLGKIVLGGDEALPMLVRFVTQALVAGADELARRLLLRAGSDRLPHDPAELRRLLDELGDVVSSLALGGPNDAPIGVGDPDWEELRRWWHAIGMPRATGVEIADHLGQVAATLLVPLSAPEKQIACSDEGKDWARLLHRGVRLGVYASVPQLLNTFFEAYLTTPPVRLGFVDEALPGMAMDKRINHNLVQTKFSELWFAEGDADRAIEALDRYLEDGTRTLPEHMDEVRAKLDALNKKSEGELDGDMIYAMLNQVLLVSPVFEARFRRQGAYSIEIYGAKGSDRFLLYPGGTPDGTNWVRVNLFWFAYGEGDPVDDFFAQFWKVLDDAEIPYRCHWGKYLPTGDGTHWDAAFRERVRRFLAIREELDPDGVFYADHWRTVLEGAAG